MSIFFIHLVAMAGLLREGHKAEEMGFRFEGLGWRIIWEWISGTNGWG
jgi:hypothetical protein